MNARAMQFRIRWIRLILRVAALGAVFISGREANAQAMFKPFSADQVHTTSKKTTTGKVYAIENAMRSEAEDKGKKSISIIRFDRKVMWVLMTDQKMYLEMPWGNSAEWTAAIKGAQVQRESLGSEQVGAYHCDKSRVTATYQGITGTYIEWAAKELDGFVVKRQDDKGAWSTEYQNVRLGAQDPSLLNSRRVTRRWAWADSRSPEYGRHSSWRCG
ncbi:MAG TPA: DUF4412 domain-containing protein [Candidatus Angelobacter sp.]|nr:DUF4412 domain-containing protein [Candidatus Angelobacter sp.]